MTAINHLLAGWETGDIPMPKSPAIISLLLIGLGPRFLMRNPGLFVFVEKGTICPHLDGDE